MAFIKGSIKDKLNNIINQSTTSCTQQKKLFVSIVQPQVFAKRSVGNSLDVLEGKTA